MKQYTRLVSPLILQVSISWRLASGRRRVRRKSMDFKESWSQGKNSEKRKKSNPFSARKLANPLMQSRKPRSSWEMLSYSQPRSALFWSQIELVLDRRLLPGETGRRGEGDVRHHGVGELFTENMSTLKTAVLSYCIIFVVLLWCIEECNTNKWFLNTSHRWSRHRGKERGR